MILEIQFDNGTIQNIDVGDVSDLTIDEKTQALNQAFIDAGYDPTQAYIIIGEA